MICVQAARARDGQGIMDMICSSCPGRGACVCERTRWRCWRGPGACGAPPRTGWSRRARSTRIYCERGDCRRRRLATAFAGPTSLFPEKLFLVCRPPAHISLQTAMARPHDRREGVTAVPTVPWGASDSKGLPRTGPGRPGAREVVGIQISDGGEGVKTKNEAVQATFPRTIAPLAAHITAGVVHTHHSKW